MAPNKSCAQSEHADTGGMNQRHHRWHTVTGMLVAMSYISWLAVTDLLEFNQFPYVFLQKVKQKKETVYEVRVINVTVRGEGDDQRGEVKTKVKKLGKEAYFIYVTIKMPKAILNFT